MPRGTKRKVGGSDTVHNDDDVILTVEGAVSKAKGARNKNRKLSALEEYDEDPGRDESRTFQKWALMFDNNIKAQAEQSKTLLKDFRGRIAQEADQLRQHQKQQGDQLIQEREVFLNDIKNTCAIALEVPTKPGESQKGQQVAGKEDHVLYQDAQSLLSQSSAMLREFKGIDERLKNYKVDLPVAEWKQDKRQMKNLVANGRQEAEEIIERLLIPNSLPTPKTDKHGVADMQDLKFFEKSHKALKDDNWGATAAEQATQLAAIVERLLPEEGTNTESRWGHGALETR